MHKEYTYEMGYYYKRLMLVEHNLKERLAHSLFLCYSTKFNIYFNNYSQKICKNPHRSQTYKKEIKAFIKKETIEYDDVYNILSSFYFSDVVDILTEEKLFWTSKAKKIFFNKVKVDKETLKPFKGYIKDLRNTLAHYNYQKYALNKKVYIKALMYFETILECNNLININDIPPYKGLPPTKFILELIYEINPKIFKNDKILLNCFDDIAFTYGYTFIKLPQRWTTIRQKFDIEKNHNSQLIPVLNKSSVLSKNNQIQIPLDKI